MNIEYIKLGLSILNFVGLILGFFYVRLERKDTATTQSIDDLELKVNKDFREVRGRQNRMETELSRIPTRGEFDAERERGRLEIVRIHQRIDEINNGIKQSQLMLGELIGISKGAKHG